MVDFHIVMEHIFSQINEDNIINKLEKAIKLDLTTLNQAYAVRSFEAKIPRFFDQSSRHHVVKPDQSYFSVVKNFEEWDLINDGYRQRLKDELNIFRESHLNTIENSLDPSSAMYTLAVLSVTEAVAWVDGLVNFIDDVYRERGG